MNIISVKEFHNIYARLCSVLGTDKQRDVGEALGMSASAISDLLAVAAGKHLPKGPKNLPYRQLVDFATSRGVSLDWLITGGETGAGAGNVFRMPVVRRISRPMDFTEPAADVAEALGMAWDVLESGTKTAEALRLNIEEFHEKITDAGPQKGRVTNG